MVVIVVLFRRVGLYSLILSFISDCHFLPVMSRVKHNHKECFERFCQRFYQAKQKYDAIFRAKVPPKGTTASNGENKENIDKVSPEVDLAFKGYSSYSQGSKYSNCSQTGSKLSSIVKISAKPVHSSTPFTVNRSNVNSSQNESLPRSSLNNQSCNSFKSANGTIELSDNSSLLLSNNSKKRRYVIEDGEEDVVEINQGLEQIKVNQVSMEIIFSNNFRF